MGPELILDIEGTDIEESIQTLFLPSAIRKSDLDDTVILEDGYEY